MKSTTPKSVEKKAAVAAKTIVAEHESDGTPNNSQKVKTSDDRVIMPNLMSSPTKKSTTPKIVKKGANPIVPIPRSPKKVSISMAALKNSSEFAKLEERIGNLRTQFEQLSMLRSTSAETLLDEYKKNVAIRDKGTTNTPLMPHIS